MPSSDALGNSSRLRRASAAVPSLLRRLAHKGRPGHDGGELLGSVPLWLHLVAATFWVGSQAMMFLVAVPALRVLGPAQRAPVLRRLAPRFAWLGFVSLAVLLLTGIENIARYAPASMFDLRYGYILTVKVALFALVALLTVLHSFVIGPRLLDEQERGGATARLRGLQAQSIVVSTLAFLLSLAALYCAALLRSRFAFGDV